jgi:hypothetical protein
VVVVAIVLYALLGKLADVSAVASPFTSACAAIRPWS